MAQRFFFHRGGTAGTMIYKDGHLLPHFTDQYTYKESTPNFCTK
jgi:hypothetical protein